jgi:HlyD family secretion protein
LTKKRLFTFSFLSIVGLLVVCGGYWVFGALFVVDKAIPAERLGKAETGSIAKSVVATGKVEPLSRVDVKSKASGLIKFLNVNAGDRVRDGQLLVELDRETLEAELKEAKAVLRSAESNLGEMQSQGKTFRANLRKAELEAENKDYEFFLAEFNRHRELFRQGLISKSDFDGIEQKMQSAAVAQKALRAAVGVREAEMEQNDRTIEKARSAVVQAQAQAERAEENLRYASIRSPIDGVVLSREVEVGDAVSSILQLGSNATTIMTLGDVRELYIKGKVDETDIGLVKLDQPVRVTVDAYKNRTFQGKVFRLAPMGVEKDNVTRFEVRVSILNNLDLLKVGMSANAEIILEEHRDVLLIPESALIYSPKRETFVEVPDPSGKTGRRQVAIRTGLGNGARTEVLSGLEPGQPVVLQ